MYCGFQNATNARNFPGLNFTPEEMAQSVAYAHGRGAKVLNLYTLFTQNPANWQIGINYAMYGGGSRPFDQALGDRNFFGAFLSRNF